MDELRLMTPFDFAIEGNFTQEDVPVLPRVIKCSTPDGIKGNFTGENRALLNTTSVVLNA